MNDKLFVEQPLALPGSTFLACWLLLLCHKLEGGVSLEATYCKAEAHHSIEVFEFE